MWNCPATPWACLSRRLQLSRVSGVVAEAVVVLAHRHDRRVAHVADGASPLGPQSGDDGIEKGLNGVTAWSAIGEVTQVQCAAELVRSQIAGMRHERVSNGLVSFCGAEFFALTVPGTSPSLDLEYLNTCSLFGWQVYGNLFLSAWEPPVAADNSARYQCSGPH